MECRGKMCRANTAKKGWADAQTPAQENAPPSSRRRCSDCTAGVFATAAKRSFATVPNGSPAKRGQNRIRLCLRQARGPGRKVVICCKVEPQARNRRAAPTLQQAKLDTAVLFRRKAKSLFHPCSIRGLILVTCTILLSLR